MDGTSSVSNVFSNNEISVYPNPAKNIFFIQLPFSNTNGFIELLNELGQTIAEKNIKGKIADFDMNSLPPGVYIIRVKYEGQVIYKKLLKD